MSNVKLTNRCGGELVDTLKSGTTLRLRNKMSATINEEELTPHIETLVSRGLVLKEIIVPKTAEKSAKKETTRKTSRKK